MKIKNKIIVFLAIIVGMLLFTLNVKAAIEIKDVGNSNLNSMLVDDAFMSCYNLRLPSSTLGNNNLDPHLSLNKDWGAVQYLTLSNYGTRMNGGRVITATINNKSQGAYTTTGNASGVMGYSRDLKHLTASLINTNPEESGTTYLKNNLNTRYVELIELDSQNRLIGVGCGFEELRLFWSGYCDYQFSNVDYIICREGLAKSVTNTEAVNIYRTPIRPVIWNN